VPEQGDDDRQADGGLRRRHRHDEEHEDLPRDAIDLREGDEREVDRV